MNRDAIEDVLDSCLLTDEELALGPDKWKEMFAEFDQLSYEITDEDWEEANAPMD